jgi:hypothetical protein
MILWGIQLDIPNGVWNAIGWAFVQVQGVVMVFLWQYFVGVVQFVFQTRWFLAILASTWLLLVMTALAHRYLWSVLARLVYPLQRFELIAKSKTLVTIGVGLIGLSSGAISWLELLSKIAQAG